MENTHNLITTSVLALLIGLIGGYLVGINVSQKGFWMEDSYMHQQESHMHENMEGHMHNDQTNHGNGAMEDAMSEMTSELDGKTGAAYEKAFLRGMIVHHRGAVQMAEHLLEKTDRPELVTFANDIISVQKQEIEKMRGWLNEWFTN